MSAKGAMSLVKAGFLSVYCDRSMLVVDFFIATSVPFIIQLLIWSRAVFPENELQKTYALSEIYLYYAAALALNRLNNAYDLIARISGHVSHGLIECFQVKPVSYMLYNAALFFGESLLYYVPPFIVAVFVVFYKGEVVGAVGFLCLLLLSQVLCFLLGYAIAAFVYWTVKPDALLSLNVIMFSAASGALLPVAFWPGWLQPAMRYNPFRLAIGGPAEFLVKPSMSLALELLSLYVYWGAALLICVFVVSKVVRVKYAGAGG